MPATGAESQLFQALAALAEQVWILKDRQVILEQVLAEHGIDLREALERYQPDAALNKRLDQERRQFIRAVLGSFGETSGPAR